MTKNKTDSIPSAKTLLELAKSIPRRDSWDSYSSKVQAAIDAADALEAKLMKNAKLIALQRKASLLKRRHRQSASAWNERRSKLIVSIKLNGVSAATVLQVKKMLGL